MLRSPGTRCALCPPLTAIDGNRSACWMPYWARARSMLSAATRRSRLFSSASAITWRRRSSAK